VSEFDYACYLVRYLLLCLCSGFVERVYWWRLVAHGYGLVDDRGGPLRKRPAYGACGVLCRVLQGASFVEAERRGDRGNDGIWVFRFSSGEGDFRIAWCQSGETTIDAAGAASVYAMVSGEERQVSEGGVPLGAEPLLYSAERNMVGEMSEAAIVLSR
jgi:hypothetical protein